MSYTFWRPKKGRGYQVRIGWARVSTAVIVSYPHGSVPNGVGRQTGGWRWRRSCQHGLRRRARHGSVQRVRLRRPPGRQPPDHRGHAGATGVRGRLPQAPVQHQEQHGVDERMAVGHVQRDLQQ